MSFSIQEYWRGIRALEDRLPEFVWLVSTAANSAGFVTEVPAIVAARLLSAKSHRVATEEEVQAHHAHEKVLVKQAKSERLRRSGAATVVVEEAKPTPGPSPKRRR